MATIIPFGFVSNPDLNTLAGSIALTLSAEGPHLVLPGAEYKQSGEYELAKRGVGVDIYRWGVWDGLSLCQYTLPRGAPALSEVLSQLIRLPQPTGPGLHRFIARGGADKKLHLWATLRGEPLDFLGPNKLRSVKVMAADEGRLKHFYVAGEDESGRPIVLMPNTKTGKARFRVRLGKGAAVPVGLAALNGAVICICRTSIGYQVWYKPTGFDKFAELALPFQASMVFASGQEFFFITRDGVVRRGLPGQQGRWANCPTLPEKSLPVALVNDTGQNRICVISVALKGAVFRFTPTSTG